jgi:choline monooxygenase
MTPLFVDADIRKASTLPSEFYTHPDYFKASAEKIFSKSWHFIGDTDELRLSNSLLPVTLLPGFMDEPILFTRDKEDVIHCLSNVCTHRGNLLVEHPCSEQQQIRCRYHGRRFDLNGKFRHMPEFEDVENFPSEKDHLPSLPWGRWERLLFASIKPASGVDDVFKEMRERVSFLPLREFKPAPSRSRDYLVKANWALYCENYLEGFHIPFIHQSLNNVIDYNSYSTELYPHSSLQLALAKGGEDAFDLPPGSPDYGKPVGAYYFWVFPNMMFNFYPWGLSINIIKPMGPSLTKVSFLTYIHDESRLDSGAGQLLDKVEREDEAVVENVQKGIQSRLYHQGRYSPKRETGTHHFHRLIAHYMNQ